MEKTGKENLIMNAEKVRSRWKYVVGSCGVPPRCKDDECTVDPDEFVYYKVANGQMWWLWSEVEAAT